MINTEWLDKIAIESILSHESKRYLAQLEIFDTLNSTNAYLLAGIKPSALSGWVCLAEEQTAGRGRQGKSWFSPKGANIYCSLLWRFNNQQSSPITLPLAAAVMVMKALNRYGIHQKIKLKWPNDIYFAHRKLAGILIETITHQGNYAAVIGVGLNLISPRTPGLAEIAIGLEEIIDEKPKRNLLAGLLIDELLKGLHRYTKEGFVPFLSEWCAHDMLQGQFVVIHENKQTMTGIAEGINEAGELIIRNPQGKLLSFNCGEVSVRLNTKKE